MLSVCFRPNEGGLLNQTPYIDIYYIGILHTFEEGGFSEVLTKTEQDYNILFLL